MTHVSVTIQITPESKPSTPSWMGEVAAFAQVLTHTETLKAIQEQVRFARARMGTYELIDFVVVLIGYALSGEPTLLTFYERLLPFAEPFMALFGRNQLPHRSTLSRFLAALDQPTVEVLASRSFKKIWLPASRLPLPAEWWIEQDNNGGLWMWMEPGLLLASVRCRRQSRCPSLIVVSTTSAHRADLGTQTRRSGAYAHDHSPGAYAPVSGHLWRAWKWGLSGRVVAGGRGDQKLRDNA